MDGYSLHFPLMHPGQGTRRQGSAQNDGNSLGHPELMCRTQKDSVSAGGAGWRPAEKPGSAELLSGVCWRPRHTPVPTAHPCPHGTQLMAQQGPWGGLCVQGEQHASLGVGVGAWNRARALGHQLCSHHLAVPRCACPLARLSDLKPASRQRA